MVMQVVTFDAIVTRRYSIEVPVALGASPTAIAQAADSILAYSGLQTAREVAGEGNDSMQFRLLTAHPANTDGAPPSAMQLLPSLKQGD